MIPPDISELEFECQFCGATILGNPTSDCDRCGGGHWTHPPTGRKFPSVSQAKKAADESKEQPKKRRKR